MGKLEKVYQSMIVKEARRNVNVFPAPIIAVPLTLFYLCLLLSISLQNISVIIWMGLYPIIIAAIAGLSYGRIFLKSLLIVPLCVLIGIFNPYYQTQTSFLIGSIKVSEGWVSLISIVIRGLFALQSVIIIIDSYGFNNLCQALRRLGTPRFLTDQLQFVYRYIMVIMQEAIRMKAARAARGYGRKRYPLKQWSTIIGQLFIRSLDRSERISKAMMARGFNGKIINYYSYIQKKKSLSVSNWIFLFSWIVFLLFLRFGNISSVIFR